MGGWWDEAGCVVCGGGLSSGLVGVWGWLFLWSMDGDVVVEVVVGVVGVVWGFGVAAGVGAWFCGGGVGGVWVGDVVGAVVWGW